MLSQWAGGWTTRDLSGSVAELQNRQLGAMSGREAWFMAPTEPALVLGSAQRDENIDTEELDRRGIELVVRRSGGGAVLVDESVLWVDLVIDRDDSLWVDDVGVAFEWVGEMWAAALEALSLGEVAMHRGPLEVGEWGRRICFASLGPGEVRWRGKKVIGISQRRTRHRARFQCSALLTNSQIVVPHLLAMETVQQEDAVQEVADRAGGLPVSAQRLGDSLRAQLGG